MTEHREHAVRRLRDIVKELQSISSELRKAHDIDAMEVVAGNRGDRGLVQNVELVIEQIVEDKLTLKPV